MYLRSGLRSYTEDMRVRVFFYRAGNNLGKEMEDKHTPKFIFSDSVKVT
jgi:hypothetical protein